MGKSPAGSNKIALSGGERIKSPFYLFRMYAKIEPDFKLRQKEVIYILSS